MLDITLRCEGKSEFGIYTHNYRSSFHHVNFHPVDGGSSHRIFTGSANPTWQGEAETAIRNHDAALRGKNPAAAAMGRVKSERKTASSRENGRKGGRPKRIYLSAEDEEMHRNLQTAGEKYDEYRLKADGEMIYLPRRGRGYTLTPKAMKP